MSSRRHPLRWSYHPNEDLTIATLCYYRLDLVGGDQPSSRMYVAFASTSDGKVAYVDWPERPQPDVIVYNGLCLAAADL